MLLKHSEQLAAHQPPTSHGIHTVFWEVLCVLCVFLFFFFPKAGGISPCPGALRADESPFLVGMLLVVLQMSLHLVVFTSSGEMSSPFPQAGAGFPSCRHTPASQPVAI